MDAKPLIMTVEDVFQIEGCGTVLTGIRGPDVALARRGALIELLTPHGATFANSIADVELFRDTFSANPDRNLGLLLTTMVPSDQLPRGTKVHDAPTRAFLSSEP